MLAVFTVFNDNIELSADVLSGGPYSIWIVS